VDADRKTLLMHEPRWRGTRSGRRVRNRERNAGYLQPSGRFLASNFKVRLPAEEALLSSNWKKCILLGGPTREDFVTSNEPTPIAGAAIAANLVISVTYETDEETAWMRIVTRPSRDGSPTAALILGSRVF